MSAQQHQALIADIERVYGGGACWRSNDTHIIIPGVSLQYADIPLFCFRRAYYLARLAGP